MQETGGSAIWGVVELLKDADKQYMGLQYDIRHAVVEGGLSWQKRSAPHTTPDKNIGD
jgi:hypothetical protein